VRLTHAHYILDEHDGRTPVEVDLMTWAEWFEDSFDKRVVKKTEHELFRVSTVFLGLDHRFSGNGPPLIFETMAFADDSWSDLECVRYATWDDAEIGHDAVVRRMIKQIRMTTTAMTRDPRVMRRTD
jgi:hypothetical protein